MGERGDGAIERYARKDTMTQTASPYLPTEWVQPTYSAFESALNAQEKNIFQELRKKGLETFLARGFPTTTVEEWRNTDITAEIRTPFPLIKKSSSLSLKDLEALFAHPLPDERMVFVDGVLSPELSSLKARSGVVVSSFSELSRQGLSKEQELLRLHIGTLSSDEERPLSALNGAFVREGALIHVAPRAGDGEALSILHVTSSAAARSLSHPRTVIIVEEGGRLSLTEYFLGSNGHAYFSNPVTEVWGSEGSEIHLQKVQCEGDLALHTGALYVSLKSKASFSSHTISFGGAKVRNEIVPVLSGEGIHCTVSGLTVLSGTQHVDNYTALDHAKPHCDSVQLFKGVYAESSSGAFRGTIVVRPDAQKTNAFQSNKSILLSENAKVATEPQLKIWADDVKCTHGATIGQLDENALFYLRARGIGKREAMAMLVHAFASEVLSDLRVGGSKESGPGRLYEELEARLSAKLLF